MKLKKGDKIFLFIIIIIIIFLYININSKIPNNKAIRIPARMYFVGKPLTRR